MVVPSTTMTMWEWPLRCRGKGKTQERTHKQKAPAFPPGLCAIRRSVRQLGQLQVAGSLLAALRQDVEADFLTFREAGQAGALNGGHVHEHVARSVARLDEAKAL